jgi:hypothetical protein
VRPAAAPVPAAAVSSAAAWPPPVRNVTGAFELLSEPDTHVRMDLGLQLAVVQPEASVVGVGVADTGLVASCGIQDLRA